MAFPLPPSESRTSIRAAGELLRDDAGSIGGVEQARILLADWRAGHLFPLHELVVDLRQRLAQLNIDAIVAFRLKRLFRIIHKLRAEPAMNATTMGDIAAFRAIVPTIQDVDAIVRDYREHAPACASERGVSRDYITSPKDNGYRSVHLALRYADESFPAYMGMRAELQIRTNMQHLWASAVESIGLYSGAHLKYDEGDPTWAEFFRIAAELIAREEGAPSLVDLEGEDVSSLRDRLKQSESLCAAMTTMREISSSIAPDLDEMVAESVIDDVMLVDLDLTAKRTSVSLYPIEQLGDAMVRYAQAEQGAAFFEQNRSAVLVSVSSLEHLREAYSTFFLDLNKFADLIQDLLQEAN